MIRAFFATATLVTGVSASAHAVPLDALRCELTCDVMSASAHTSVGDALEHPRAHAAAVANRHRAHRHAIAAARLHPHRHAPVHSIRNVSTPLAAAPAPAEPVPAPARPRHASTPARYASHHGGSSKFAPRHAWAGPSARATDPGLAAESPREPLGLHATMIERLLEGRGPPRAGPTDASDDPATGVDASLEFAPPSSAPLPARLTPQRALPSFSPASSSAMAPLRRRARSADFEPLRRCAAGLSPAFHPPPDAAHARAPDMPGRAFQPGRRRRVPVARAYEGARRRSGSLVEEIVP